MTCPMCGKRMSKYQCRRCGYHVPATVRERFRERYTIGRNEVVKKHSEENK